MHVLSNPEHHASRKKWAESKEKSSPELIGRIRELGEITNTWTIIIDSDRWSEIRQMEIVEMLSYFRKMTIYQWNEWMQYSGKTMSMKERDQILQVMEDYYREIFRREEAILRAYLGRILKKEREKCENEGLWEWCKKIHPRLCVEQDTVTYLKNREYRYLKEDIHSIFITASTFVAPHLWLYHNPNELEIVKGVIVEQSEYRIPKDFVRIFKTLGDGTRLQIIRHLMDGICTTRDLACEMGISEAAVSKHLKIMKAAGLVRKSKQGFYMKYEFVTEMIDYIPYAFYETMLQ